VDSPFRPIRLSQIEEIIPESVDTRGEIAGMFSEHRRSRGRRLELATTMHALAERLSTMPTAIKLLLSAWPSQ
jgi:hypothetical protein